MDMQELLSYPWRTMLPEFIILGVATLLSILDLFMKDKVSRNILAYIGLGGVVAALVLVVTQIQMVGLEQPVYTILYDTYRLDGFAIAFKLIFLIGVAICLLLSLDYVKTKEISYEGEFYYLILTGLLGAMILASSADMITLFVGLELLSLSSFILVGLRKKRLQSNESAFKYVVSGGIATAIMLYGMSFIYGLTGTSNLFEIRERLLFAYNEGYDFLLFFAFFLMFVGMAFKISVVPFHMWAPDVYQGAPTPITAFLSVVSKAAGFALMLRIFIVTIWPVGKMDQVTGQPDLIFYDLGFYLAIAAAISMILGNALALRQTNIKRMFAYSSIAQAGYILVPMVTLSHVYFIQNNQILSTMIFYLFTYLFMNLGAFAVIQTVTNQAKSEELKAFAGLYHRSPWQAFAMTIFLLSLAGLPVTGGFMAKFMIFMVSIEQSSFWLAIIMVLTSVVSYFYYFGIIRQMFMRAGESDQPIRLPYGVGIVIVVCLVGTILLGIWPSDVLEILQQRFHISELFVR